MLADITLTVEQLQDVERHWGKPMGTAAVMRCIRTSPVSEKDWEAWWEGQAFLVSAFGDTEQAAVDALLDTLAFSAPQTRIDRGNLQWKLSRKGEGEWN